MKYDRKFDAFYVLKRNTMHNIFRFERCEGECIRKIQQETELLIMLQKMRRKFQSLLRRMEDEEL